MLKAVYVENFLRIDAKITIELAPVTILVGGNGSGKSSILKAIHWAVRCATLKDHNDNTSLEQMDYTPSRDFQKLAHKKLLQNKSHTPRIKVGFIDDTDNVTEINLSLARNDAGAKALISGPLSSALTDEKPQTAYIPGLAGLSELETVLAAPVLRRRAASGEGGSVLRHILLDLVGGSAADETEFRELTELSKWVSKVFPDSRIWVKFDRLRDVRIEACFFTPDMREPGKSFVQQRRPLEMAATGYLQVVQIFAYLLLFKPKLLLIDEPDAHLHPGTQERLIRALEAASTEFPETKFLATTHSSHLVRACSERSHVLWLDNGALANVPQDTIRLRMGWGALDKELILFSEDKNLIYMKGILSQWPELERKILVWPTFGKGGISSGSPLSQLRQTLCLPVFVHRDRDFMSETDIAEWRKRKEFDEHNVDLWVPPESDIEQLFCNERQIAAVMEISEVEAGSVIEDALKKFNTDDAEREFNTALDGAVRELPSEHRSIPSARWRALGGFGRHTIKGKDLMPKIKDALRDRFRSSPEKMKLGRLQQLSTPSFGVPVATDLKAALEKALGLPRT